MIVMSSAYAITATEGHIAAAFRRVGWIAAANSMGPRGSPCRTPLALTMCCSSKPGLSAVMVAVGPLAAWLDLAFSLATAATRPPRPPLPRAPRPPRPLDAACSPSRALAGGFPAAASAARSRSSLCRAVPTQRRSIAATCSSSSATAASSTAVPVPAVAPWGLTASCLIPDDVPPSSASARCDSGGGISCCAHPTSGPGQAGASPVPSRRGLLIYVRWQRPTCAAGPSCAVEAAGVSLSPWAHPPVSMRARAVFPPRPPPSGQARVRPPLHASPAQSQPLQLPLTPDESASSLQAPPPVPAQSAPPVLPSRTTPLALGSTPSPQSQPPVPTPPPVHPAPLSSADARAAVPQSVSASDSPSPLPQPDAPPAPLPSAAPPIPPFAHSYPPRLDATEPALPAPRWRPPAAHPCQPRRQHPLVAQSRLPRARFGFVSGLVSRPVPGLSRGYWNDDEVPGTPRDPDVDWWAVSWPQEQRGADGDWGTPPPDAPWGEPRPGDGAYQARGMRLSDAGRCVTELSFVLDLLHDAFESHEVVARDPQLAEGQRGRARCAVSSALWDILRLPLEPEDPSLDDGPGAAAFRMVATAVEECPLGIVPAIACVLRWLGRRVERM
ncbi:unnamed protein product [Closterium sp. Naga37s-1]|nr:unnamed protein product [Closterium sp. Naga37s-1]